MPEIVIVAAIVTGGALFTQQQAERSAEKRQKKQIRATAAAQARQMGFETEAGEHFEELNVKQMELQSQQHQITLLADIIQKEDTPAQQIFTLPPAKTYSPLERINQAIDDLLRGG